MKKFLFLSLLIYSSFFLFSQSTELWGLTNKGGNFCYGGIYKMDSIANNLSLEHSFYKNDGSSPLYNQLFEANNGKIYGFTNEGGKYGHGILFEFNPNRGQYEKKVDFNGFNNGSWPTGSFVQDTNGNLYGVTKYGGNFGMGVLYEYNITLDTLIVKQHFDGFNKGENPQGSLTYYLPGKYIGTTVNGGAYNKGVIYQYDLINDTIIKKYDFDGGFQDGSNPSGNLIIAKQSSIVYGTVANDGAFGIGQYFAFDLATDSILHITAGFSSNGMHPHGAFPVGTFIKANDTTLFTMAPEGGSGLSGTIIRIQLDLSQVNGDTIGGIYHFAGNVSGAKPYGNLSKGTNGKLYGITSKGGNNDAGVIFEYNPDSLTFRVRYHLDSTLSGADFRGSLLASSSGKMYGMSSSGGLADKGVLFQYNPITNFFLKILDFDCSLAGVEPNFTTLKQHTNGMLYGITATGGLNKGGVLYEMDPLTSTFIKKVDFDGLTHGANPSGTVVEINNVLYGLNQLGGTHNMGTIYSYNLTSNQLTAVHHFNDSTLGRYPFGSLIVGRNGKLYGMTLDGGHHNKGVIFEYDLSSNTYSKEIDLQAVSSGFHNRGGLIETSNGIFYGLNSRGGTSNQGTLFQYNENTNQLSIKVNFNGASLGGNPEGTLLDAPNGKLYGVTKRGGTFGQGILFEYDPILNSISTKINFNGTNGNAPIGALILASNGKIYGVTYLGGSSSAGTVFEYDYISNQLLKKQDFNVRNGQFPVGGLIEINKQIVGLNELTNSIKDITIYPNPTLSSIIINQDDSTNSLLKIYNSNYQLINKLTINKKHYQFDLEGPAGIYLFEFTRGKYKKLYKIVKQ